MFVVGLGNLLLLLGLGQPGGKVDFNLKIGLGKCGDKALLEILVERNGLVLWKNTEHDGKCKLGRSGSTKPSAI